MSFALRRPQRRLPSYLRARLALFSVGLGAGACRSELRRPWRRGAGVHRASRPSRSGAEVAGRSPSTGAAEPGAPAVDVAALAPLLEQAPLSGPSGWPTRDRLALEQAMQRCSEPAAASATAVGATVSLRRRGRWWRPLPLRPARGERRSDGGPRDLPSARSGRRTRPGPGRDRRSPAIPPASLAGEHLFVWPGRFEIRAFGRAESLRGRAALEKLLSSLPLDALAKL